MSRSSRKTLGPTLRKELGRAVRHQGAHKAMRLLLLFPPLRGLSWALRAFRMVRGR